MNKVILNYIRIMYRNLGEIIVLLALCIFIYTMFTINKTCGLVASSAVIFIIGLIISTVHNPK